VPINGNPFEIAIVSGALPAIPVERLRRWQIPLVTVLSGLMEGEVNVRLTGFGLVDFQSTGLKEILSAPGSKDVDTRRSFRYGSPSDSLEISERTPITAQLPEPHVGLASLNTYVEGTSGKSLHHFEFELSGWNQPNFPVRLPGETRFLAARVDGRWIA